MEKLSQYEDCHIRPPSGRPSFVETLPDDLDEFYHSCGGVSLFDAADYSIDIVAPNEFVRANPVIALDDGRDDISYDWYIIGKSGEQYITIDLNEKRRGRCYDSNWDCHAVAGSCPIIAKSFTELFERLIESRGLAWFWLSENFSGLGDAYDDE
ncbi:MAG: hypothetical protein KDA65_04875 [Planctomycetaceae bacterium]|nr:hypothetical protein [Planctomycetaceae bacterium]